MRYRVRHGFQAIRRGRIIARAGETVEVDLDVEDDRRWVEAMDQALEPLPEPEGWVERRDEYEDRAMTSRRRSNR